MRATALILLLFTLFGFTGIAPGNLSLTGSADPALAAAPWNGVPHITVDYTKDVETWWASHPFNPESPAYAPNITSPANQLNVRTQYGGNIQAAIDALPATGGTLFFPAGAYNGNFRLVGKSNIHFRGETGSVIRGTGQNRIAGCALADDYSTFGAYIQARVPEALLCATTGRIKNLYFKDLVFDGGGVASEAFDMSAAMDIVFDNIVFQNFKDPGVGHPGIISGNAVIDNIWVRNSRFVGQEQYAMYLDGIHGGGVINSTIENGFSRSAFLFLTNDDYSRDYDGDGTIEVPEQRMSQHVVVYGNTFAGGTYDLVSATGRNILIMANTIAVPVVTVANFQSKSSAVDARLTYEYFSNRVVRNYFRSIHQFIEISPPPQCPKVTNCAKIGQYQIRDNVVESAANYVRPATASTSTYGTVTGPNTVSGNCIADPACRGVAGGGGATPTATPTGSSTISQRFPLGLFEDANMTEGLNTKFQTLINDAKAKGLDSVLFNNNYVDRDEPMLSLSDSQNFNVYFAPHRELNSGWFYGSAPSTIEAARALAYPIVDRIKAHPSLRGYNLVDEPGVEHQDKLTLMVRAFKERDATRPSLPVLIGLNRGDTLFSAAQPGVFLADVYPMGNANAPCNYTMTGFGYTQEDFSSYIRRLTANKPAGTPLWVILQTHKHSEGPSYALRVPTAPELRAQQWMAVGEGATGIFWFVYSTQQDWTGLKDSPALFTEVGNLANRLGPLRTTLVDTDRVANIFTVTGPNSPYVSTLKSNDGRRTFAVVVNKGTCSGSAGLAVSSGIGGTLKDLETGAVFAQGAQITFAAGDGKVFELIPDGSSTPAPTTTATRTPTAPAATATRTPTAPAGATATPTRTPTRTPTAPAGATATPVSTPSSTGNLVKNSSFDTLTSGYSTDWRQRSNSSYDPGISHTGRGSLRLASPASSSYVDQAIALKPSTTYVLRFWTRTLDAVGTGVAVRYAQTAPAAQTLIQAGYVNGTKEWKEQTYTFTTPANHAGGRIDVQWTMSSGVAWVDDISLEELNPAATNLVTNGTFDQATSGFPTAWRARPNAVWTSNVVRTGAGSFEVRGPAPDAYSDQAIKLRPNTSYILTYWVRTMNATGPGVSVRYSQLSPTPLTLVVSPETTGSRAWTQITVRFTTPANYTDGRLDIRWNLTGGYAWIDDMALFED
ncbi:MAG: carbohydrate binding domain-containing protein [Chloroflexi bacterium]|nr:carbohydrate binding domain-containing protein [Chloroflexota bacterium]